MSVRRATLSAVTGLTATALSTLAMILAARRGQFIDIGSYASGSATTALVAVLCGSGTTLNFVTGGVAEQRAVMTVRKWLVLPALMIAALASAAVASVSGVLDASAVLCGGLFVVLSNMVEIASGALQRALETRKILIGTVLGRCVWLAFVLAGQAFSRGALSGMLVTLIVLGAFALPYLPRQPRTNLRNSFPLAFRGRMMQLALADALAQKAPFVVAPHVLSSAAASGEFSTLVSGQQSLLALLAAPLYSAMANASSVGRQDWAIKVERWALASAVLIAIGGMMTASFFVQIMGMPNQRAVWWALLVAAIPVALANRITQYRALAEKNVAIASMTMTTVAACTLVVCGLALMDYRWLLVVPLAGELGGRLILYAQLGCGAGTSEPGSL